MISKTIEAPGTTVPIWQVPELSLHAKVVWSCWHVGLSISDDAWHDYLKGVRAPYVPLEECRDELRRSGWLPA